MVGYFGEIPFVYVDFSAAERNKIRHKTNMVRMRMSKYYSLQFFDFTTGLPDF